MQSYYVRNYPLADHYVPETVTTGTKFAILHGLSLSESLCNHHHVCSRNLEVLLWIIFRTEPWIHESEPLAAWPPWFRGCLQPSPNIEFLDIINVFFLCRLNPWYWIHCWPPCYIYTAGTMNHSANKYIFPAGSLRLNLLLATRRCSQQKCWTLYIIFC